MFNLITFNVRGIRNRKKRKNIFHWLNSKQCNICFLQEAYCCQKDIAMWEKEYNGTFYYSTGTNHSKGVLIGISNRLDDISEVKKIYSDEDGRILGVSIIVDEVKYNLWNVYAPNDESDRKAFFEQVNNIIETYSIQGHTLLGGDFNTVLNPSLDKIGGNVPNPMCADVLTTMLNEYDLTDIWRMRHGEEKRFTWKQNSPPVMCTLDYWFIPHVIEHTVDKIEIMSAPRSDHLAVCMSINHDSNMIKGDSYWKFNNSWLQNDDYNKGIKDLIDVCVNDYGNNLAPKHFWDLCKTKIRSFSIDFAKGAQKERQSELKLLECKLQKLYQNCVDYPDDVDMKKQYNSCKLEYEVLYTHFMKGLQIRSKEKWIEEGEKCTKYFLNLEKKNASRKSINKLQCKNGEVTVDQSVILNEEVAYFSELYTSKVEVSEIELDRFFQDTNFPSLNNDQSDSCEGLLTKEECLTALKLMAKNKSPGYDGLTVEFYQHFWSKIGDNVVDAINDAYQSGSLTTSQNRGIISLIHKGKGLARDSLDNWRPIALLNTDYKIATKALAKRVQSILRFIVDTDQNGFVKGRSIHENIRLIEDVLRYTDDSDLPGIMMCIDFKKAFDSIEREYILYALKKLNFGPMFIKWVSVIFSNTTSCILNNGHVSSAFHVNCGVRQGCPISSLIYVLSTELLACKIRQSSKIQGISLPSENYERNEVRLSTFADDTTIFVKTQNCILEIIDMFDTFSRLSGLTVNHAKSDALWIGSQKNNNFSIGNVNWKLAPNNTVKILGVTFSPSTPVDKISSNWDDKMKKIECSIRAWKMRGLSMIGRNLVVKTLLASQLSYLAPILNFPDSFMNKLNRLFFKFIWNRGEAVKRNTIIADYEKGGINVFNVKLFFDSLKLSWIKKLIDPDVACWKNIPLYYINKCGMGMTLFNWNCNFSQINDEVCKRIINSFPKFYYNLVKIWFDTKRVSDGNDFSELQHNVIWNNNIVSLNNKTLFYRDWIDCGIIFVRDLFDDNGYFYPLQHWMNVIKRKGGILLQYFALREALPRQWQEQPINVCLDHDEVKITFNSVSVETCSTKYFRNALVDKVFIHPLCENHWKRRFPNYNFVWENIWLSIPKCTKEARLISLNWKIIHNIYPTRALLYKMGKEESDLCSTCNIIDNQDHFFFDCIKIKQIWALANHIITDKLNQQFKLSVEDVLFNYNINICDDRSKFINLIIAIGKMCISKFKYGDHPCLLFLFERELRLRGLIPGSR